jgi:flagellar motor switch protein FliN/FliY
MANAAILDDAQYGVVSDAVNAGLSSAAASLGGLLDKTVSISAGEITGKSPDETGAVFGGGIAVVKIQFSGKASGGGVLLMQESAAALMADFVIGGDGSDAPATLSDLHLSAVGEAAGQAASGLAEGMGVEAMPSDLEVMQAGDLSGLSALVGDEAVSIDLNFDIEGNSSQGVLLLSSDFANALSSGGGGAAMADETGFNETTQFTDQGGGAPVVQRAEMSQISGGSVASGAGNLDLIMDVPLQVTVELGRTTKVVKEILSLGPGSVVELDKLAGEPVDILVNEKPIAKGEVVVIDENFGVRVTQIINPQDRINL